MYDIKISNHTIVKKGKNIMAERKPRATKEEALNAKIAANLAAQAKLVEKLDALKSAEADLKQQLDDLKNAAKKAEKAVERKALKAAKAKAEKELMKAIKKSGLSMEAVKEKLGIE